MQCHCLSSCVNAIPIHGSTGSSLLRMPTLSGTIQGLTDVVLFARREYARFGRSWSATIGLVQFLAALRRKSYDLVIDLHGQFRSAVLALVTGAQVRIGFDRPRRAVVEKLLERLGKTELEHGWTGCREGAWLAYTRRIPIPTLDVHAIDRYLWVGRLLGLNDEPPDGRIYLPAEAQTSAEQLLTQHGVGAGPLAMLVPGTIWQTKHWRVEGFAEVGKQLLQEGMSVLLTGSPCDRQCCQKVAAACPGAYDLSGQTTLAELGALIRRSVVCVTNDSGSMHLAVALNQPVVSVFGPTEPLWVGPYGRSDAVVRGAVPCARATCAG